MIENYMLSARDRILAGALQHNKYDDEYAHAFIKLLKKLRNIMSTCPHQMNKKMLVNTVKRLKKQGTLSIFSDWCSLQMRNAP